jgi:general nucleoside transport system permease protein
MSDGTSEEASHPKAEPGTAVTANPSSVAEPAAEPAAASGDPGTEPPAGARPGQGGSRLRRTLLALPRILGALAATLAVMAVVILIMGADPVRVAEVVIESSTGDPFVLGQTIMIAGILTLTGLAAAIPFRAGLWNVGAEGQLYAGAIAAAAVALTVSPEMPSTLAVPLVLLAALVGGAVWGVIAGGLKAALDLNEVIVSLMLTFIAILAADYVVRVLWPQGISPQTERIPPNTIAPMIWQEGLVTIAPIVAVVAAVVGWFLIRHTGLGFQIRAVGFNATTARANGISSGRVAVWTFVIGGAVAGLAGGLVVSGVTNALVSNFSPNYGFLGIAVALIARLEPLWLVPAAFVFAMLRVGSNGLEVDVGLSSALGDVLVTIFIISLLFFGLVKLPTARGDL